MGTNQSTSLSPWISYSDEQLLAEYQRTSNTALIGELYKRYAHLVLACCKKYIRNTEECQDIAMSIFEKMLTGFSFTEVLDFKKWLLVIVRNECLNFLKTSQKMQKTEENWHFFAESEESFMENATFSTLIDKPPSEAVVWEALKKLNKPQRKCMKLFFFEEMSYKEIAEETSFSLREVKSYLQNGKRNLKQLLETAQRAEN